MRLRFPSRKLTASSSLLSGFPGGMGCADADRNG